MSLGKALKLYACGAYGFGVKMIGYNGTSWSSETLANPLADSYFNDVWATADGAHVLAAGDRGYIEHKTTAWASEARGNLVFFRSLSGAPDGSRIFAVGDSTKPHCWTWTPLDGWASQTEPFTDGKSCVWARSRFDAWMGGNNGRLARWDGSSWALHAQSPLGTYVLSIWGVHSNSVYLVTTVSGVSKLYHFDGVSWSLVRSMNVTSTLRLHGSSADNIWACGSGTKMVERFDGISWTGWTEAQIFGATYSSTMRALYVLAPDDVWVAGDKMPGMNRQAIAHWDGTAWTWVDTGLGLSWPVYGLWAVEPPEVVAHESNEGTGWLINDRGDYELTSLGHLRRDNTIATRCRIRLRTRRGNWPYDVSLGSRLHTIATTKNAEARVRDYIHEALKPLVDSGEIASIDIGPIEVEHQAGMVAARVNITVPGIGVVPLGAIPVGAAS